MNINKRSDIQYLRALAVIGVILFHAYPSIFPMGFLGVDLFFLISGFLIFPQLLKAISAENRTLVQTEIKRFLVRRVRRIAPALGFSVSIFMILGYFFLPPSLDYANKQNIQSVSAILGFGNLIALIQSGDYFNSDSPFVHFWTLGVEIQTYLFSAIFSYFTYRYFKKRSQLSAKRLLCKGLIAITITSVAAKVVTLQYPEIFELLGVQRFAIAPTSFDFYFTINRLWEFSIGGWIALRSADLDFSTLIPKTVSKFKNIFLVLTGLAIFFPVKSSSVNIVTLFLIVVASIYLLTPQVKNSDSLFSSVVVWVGDRSYSLYLLHLPLIIMFGGSFIPFKIRPYLTVLALITTFLLGNLSYLLIEKRFRSSESIVGQSTSINTKNRLSMFAISYVIPLTMISTFLLINIHAQGESPEDTSWSKNYAASDFFPCPLGQLNRECQVSGNSEGDYWLLVGDSHAGALQQTLNDVAVSRGANLRVWNKCRFFDPDISSELNSYFPDWCLHQNSNRLKVINSGKVNLLLISYFNSEVKYGDKTLPERVWNDVFSQTLRELKTNKVLVFSQVPTYSDSANDRPRISFPADEVISLSKILHMSDVERTTDKEMVISGGVDYLDISSAYCNNYKCVRKDKDWLYVDTNHLSISGAKLMRPLLESYIDAKF